MAAMILVKNLIDMGFSRERAEIAVAATDCKGVQTALEWLLKEENQIDQPSTSTAAAIARQTPKETTVSSVVTKRLLVDPSWELIDPTPDIHALFVSFSKEFFWDKLGGVQVKWSPRMTSCAGVCSFSGRSRECVISLSKPLLTLRPRKDLVETLLHEMIHAYLFLDSGTTDREAHGEQFHFHMYRINKKSGTNITVYHSFNEEVRHYRTHWWKCNGPCQHKPPYFGIVKRAMNRAPGPSDFWHEQHQRECGGTFIKIREPEKDVKKGSGNSKGSSSTSKQTVLSPSTSSNVRKITEYFPVSPKKSTQEGGKPAVIHTIKSITGGGGPQPRSASGPCCSSSTSAAGQSQNSSSASGSTSHLFPGVGRKLNENGAPTKKMKF